MPSNRFFNAKQFALLPVLLLALTALASADEGMWLFNAFPGATVKSKYGFEPSKAWLDHVRLSSARAPNGSSSFVSPDGLILTNHHIAQGCVTDLSSNGHDYMKSGFYAATRAEEPKCPGLEFIVLENIEDVTTKVNAAVKPGMSAADSGKVQREEMSTLEKECSVNGMRCDVVTLYAGALYHLYRYKKYDDIRLVFAPEFDIAFFGGDPDNFEYPRYDLDISFFRAYENGQPAKIRDYLKWSATGAKEGDLIFVSGHPGNTGRLLTTAQLEFLRDYQYPLQLANYQRTIAVLQDFGARSEESAREANHDLFGAQNSFKAVTGYEAALRDRDLMASKASAEEGLRQYIAADPKRRAEFGDPWHEIANAMEVRKQIYKPMAYVENMLGFRGSLALYAREIVRAAEERQKASNQRMRGYTDSALPTLEQQLFSSAPVYKQLEQVRLAESLTEMREILGPDNDTVRRVLAGKSTEQRARELIEGTKLEDLASRKQLYQGGTAAVAASSDPLIALMRDIDPAARALYQRNEDEVESVLRRDAASIAKARFAQNGLGVAPDATFTLRLSYGPIKGYDLDGKHVPWFTTIGGAYQHAAGHGDQPPYRLPDSWIKAKSSLDMNTPFDTVSTPDIIGGNSGSPVINKDAELVGIIFDGNIQSLSWDFLYSDNVARAIATDSRAILESLRKIYHADALVGEIMAARQAKSPQSAAARKSKNLPVPAGE